MRAAYAEREPVAWPRRHARPLVAVAGRRGRRSRRCSARPAARSSTRSARRSASSTRRPELFSLPSPGGCSSRAAAAPGSSTRTARGAGSAPTATPPGRRTASSSRPRRPTSSSRSTRRASVRWTLAAPLAALPDLDRERTDTRIAYLAGGRLRVVAGDGTGDHAVGPAVAPAWRPARTVLAYADGPGRQDSNGRVVLDAWLEPAQVRWSYDGQMLLVCTARARTGQGVQQDDPSDATLDRDAVFVGRRTTSASARPARAAASSPTDGRRLPRHRHLRAGRPVA